MLNARLAVPVFLIPSLLAGTSLPAMAQEPEVMVTGRVVGGSSSAWIGGATVRLDDLPPIITDYDGKFFFYRLSPGAHRLSVEAMGYRSQTLVLNVQRDTVLNFVMEVDPVRLEEILVRPGTITIKGTVISEETGRRVANARAWLPGRPWEVTSLKGKFKLKQVPKGWPTTLFVSALGLMPAGIALITERDTTVTVVLGPDSVGIKMLEEQIQRVETRARAVGMSSRFIDRSRLEGFAGVPVSQILSLWGVTIKNRQCVFVDENPEHHLLDYYVGADLERIEVYRRGEMIRVYTREFMVSLQRDDKRLGSIVLMGGSGHVTCF